jgi:hypothetical protein
MLLKSWGLFPVFKIKQYSMAIWNSNGVNLNHVPNKLQEQREPPLPGSRREVELPAAPSRSEGNEWRASCPCLGRHLSECLNGKC